MNTTEIREAFTNIGHALIDADRHDLLALLRSVELAAVEQAQHSPWDCTRRKDCPEGEHCMFPSCAQPAPQGQALSDDAYCAISHALLNAPHPDASVAEHVRSFVTRLRDRGFVVIPVGPQGQDDARDAARYRWLCSLQSGRPESQIALAQVILAMRKNPEAVSKFIDEQIALKTGEQP